MGARTTKGSLKMNDWNAERTDIFKSQLMNLFVSFNRSATNGLIDMKVKLLEETLKTLRTDKIKPFFRYIMENEKTIPSDGRLKEILRDKYKEYSTNQSEAKQIEYTGGVAPADWVARYMKQLVHVVDGNLTPQQAYQNAEAG
jgi:hypothetical protein